MKRNRVGFFFFIARRMKFGKNLEEHIYPPYRSFYIAYKDLKEAIKLITGEERFAETTSSLTEISVRRNDGIHRHLSPEAQFQDLLDHELKKINTFTSVQFQVLLEEIRDLLYRISALSASASRVDMKDSILTLKSEIVQFDQFIRLNFSGFRKALKKFDKSNKSNSSNWFLQRIVRSSFMGIQMDKLVHGIAILELQFLSIGTRQVVVSSRPSDLPIYQEPSKFKRTKFFIPSDDLIRIEMDILRKCKPVLAQPIVSLFSPTVSDLVEGFKTSIVGGRLGGNAGEIAFFESAIVFDNDEFAQYISRRAKTAGTNNEGYNEPVFSVRWNQFQAKESRCFVVKEMHPKYPNKGGRLFQIELRQKQVSDLLLGKASPESIASSTNLNAMAKSFLSEFGESVSKYKPSCMYSYRRTIFESQNSAVVIAVDKDIKFVDLRSRPIENVFSISPLEFQAILSVRTMTIWQDRLAPQSELSDWVEKNLRGNPAVTEVSGFSKAVHAEAVLHIVTEIERPVSAGLPNWFIHTVSGFEDKREILSNLMISVDEAGGDNLLPPSVGPAPMASPIIAGATMDIMPEKFASSQMLLHDLAAANGPKQARSVGISSGGIKRSATVTPLLPAPAPAPLGNELDAPLLVRRPSPRASQSLWDQLKFVFFGSVAPQEIPDGRSKIESKTFLANERTFLNWCYVSFMVSAAAITLKSVDQSASVESACLTVSAIIILVWALNVYRLRVIALRKIKDLDSVMVSSTGATTVALVVVFALSVTWLGRYRSFSI